MELSLSIKSLMFGNSAFKRKRETTINTATDTTANGIFWYTPTGYVLQLKIIPKMSKPRNKDIPKIIVFQYSLFFARKLLNEPYIVSMRFCTMPFIQKNGIRTNLKSCFKFFMSFEF